MVTTVVSNKTDVAVLACETCVVEAYWKEGDGGDGGKQKMGVA